ncbi:MAG: hypothetical protein V4850_08665 [Myxococcota bacterium]
MTTTFSAAGLRAALEAAAAALGDTPVVWVLPTATLAPPLELDLAGRSVSLRGGTLVGELRLRGAARLDIEGLSVDILDIEGDQVHLETVRAGRLRLRATGATVTNQRGGAVDAEVAGLLRVVGLRARGGDVRLQAGELEVSELDVAGVSGPVTAGARLAATNSVVVVGARVADVSLDADGAGLELDGGRVVLRGVTVRAVTAVGRVAGLLVRCSAGAEIEVGSVTGIAGASSHAIRVEAAPSREGVLLRELAVRDITGGAVGVGVHAAVDEGDPVLRDGEPGTVRLEDLVLDRIAGPAAHVEGGLRNLELVRIEAWVGGGLRLDGDRILLASMSLVDQAGPVRVGPAELWMYGILALRAGAPPVQADPAAVVATAQALYADAPGWPWRAWPTAPFAAAPAIDLGSLAFGALPAPVDHDLSVHPDFAPLAVAVPSDVREDGSRLVASVGARPATLAPVCTSSDPEARPAEAQPAPLPADPVLDYRAHDYAGLLELMKRRIATTTPDAAPLVPADLTTAVLELFASELDRIAWLQEAGAAERTLVGAQRRRSVEDHARTLDYTADPGLSATALLRFSLDHAMVDTIAGAAAAGAEEPLRAHLAAAGLSDLCIPAGTVVANGPFDAWAAAFSTDEDLVFDADVDDLRLAADVLVGDCRAVVPGTLPSLAGRWLVLEAPDERRHVVRVTTIELAAGTTVIHWDPRRPAPAVFARLAPSPITGEPVPTRICANFVSASHALWLDPGVAGPFAGWTRALTVRLADGASTREVELPYAPLSRVAPGWPLPTERARRGEPRVSVQVEGDPWRRVDDLSLAGADEEVFVLRAGLEGRTVVRFGDGTNGAPLPEGPVELVVGVAVGLGTVGNVGAGALTGILSFGAAPPGEAPLHLRVGADGATGVEERLRALIRVTNPLSAVGGREPEPTERIRRRAPVVLWTPQTAVTADDCAALVAELAEVAGARAEVLLGGLRPLVRVTVLLRDEDTLPDDEVLRRWAVVRQRLEAVRMCGIEVESVPPRWVSLDLDLSVDAHPHAHADVVDRGVRAALAGEGGLFDPDRAGLGGDVHLSDIYAAVAAVPGVAAARVLRLRRWTAGAPAGGVVPVTGTTRVSLGPPQKDWIEEGVLPIGAHEVATLRRLAKREGLLTLSVCGGLR